ncbi:MAG: MFS transporter [Acidobacteria bacterium]|nr:MFS transporter [Acidobacteriota bacterium]
MKKLLPVFLVIWVDLLGFSIILPLLPYYAKSLSLSDQIIGLLVATYSICQFIAGPFLGEMSDIKGRRPVLLYSQIGSLLGFIVLGSALFLPNPVIWLFLSRVIDGLSGGNVTVVQAYISDVLEPEEWTKGYAIIGAAFGLGFLFGPALGGVLSTYGYEWPAYAAACCSLISIIGTFFLLPEPKRRINPDRKGGLAVYLRVFDYFRISSLRNLLIIFLFFVLPFNLYTSMFSLYALKQLSFTARDTGYFLAVVGLFGIIWQGGAVGPIVKRLGETKSLILGLTSNAIGLFSIVFVDVWWKLIVVAVFFSFGTGMTRPALTSLITQSAPEDRRGGVLGITSSIESFSRIAAPLIGGWLIGGLHANWLGLAGGIFTLIALLLTVLGR